MKIENLELEVKGPNGISADPEQYHQVAALIKERLTIAAIANGLVGLVVTIVPVVVGGSRPQAEKVTFTIGKCEPTSTADKGCNEK